MVLLRPLSLELFMLFLNLMPLIKLSNATLRINYWILNLISKLQHLLGIGGITIFVAACFILLYWPVIDSFFASVKTGISIQLVAIATFCFA